jgi:hypothetical protein
METNWPTFFILKIIFCKNVAYSQFLEYVKSAYDVVGQNQTMQD